jgi:hypothetical protein
MFDQSNPSKLCSVCQVELSHHQALRDGLCSSWRCRETFLQRSLETYRANAAKDANIDNPEAWHIFVIPEMNPVIVKQSPNRRMRFIKSFSAALCEAADNAPGAALRKLTNTASDESSKNNAVDDKQINQQVNSLLLETCKACNGKCCSTGGDHAYLTAEHLAKYLEAHSDDSVSDVYDLYLRYLPERSVQDSCVFVTETGCNLPRDLRADICNTYECNGLKRYRIKLEQDGPVGGFAVVRENNKIIRASFIE